jgi:hypothetical protein
MSAVIVKSIAVLTLVFILASLGIALFSLVKDKGQSERTVKALTVRIGLSIALLAFVMICGSLGLIDPNPAP